MKVLLINEPDDYFILLGQNIVDQYILKNEGCFVTKSKESGDNRLGILV